MFILHNKRFDMTSWFGFPEYIFYSERDIHLFIFFTYLVRRIIRHSMTLLANFVTPKSVKKFQAWTTHHRLFYYSVVTNIDCIYISLSLSVRCVDYNTFKHMAWNPSSRLSTEGLGPRHGEVRRAHQMSATSLVLNADGAYALISYRERKCAKNYNKWHNKFIF